jgi:hypothetical protein
MWRAGGLECSLNCVIGIVTGRDEHLTAGQCGEVPDVRLQAVLADQNGMKSPAAARESLYVERMTLSVGDQDNISRCTARQHAGECKANFSSAARFAEALHGCRQAARIAD